MSRAAWMDRPHEIREDVADGSMCRCGLPIDDNHDRVLAPSVGKAGDDR